MGLCGSKAAAGGNAPNPQRVDASHFSLVRQIGKGGFAEVFVARRLTHQQELVAIKRVDKFRVLRFKDEDEAAKDGSVAPRPRPNTTSSAASRARDVKSRVRMSTTVWTERNVWTLVDSPFLVPLLHAFQDDKFLYFVLPLFPGGDLSLFLKHHGVMDESTLRFYAAEIVLALEAMHSMGIVYRDLKPHNLLFRPDGHICLTDFGLCKQNPANGDGISDLRGRIGTKGYQAPEIVRGIGHSYPVDFFALGVTLFRLVTDARLFNKNMSIFPSVLPVPDVHRIMRPPEDPALAKAVFTGEEQAHWIASTAVLAPAHIMRRHALGLGPLGTSGAIYTQTGGGAGGAGIGNSGSGSSTEGSDSDRDNAAATNAGSPFSFVGPKSPARGRASPTAHVSSLGPVPSSPTAALAAARPAAGGVPKRSVTSPAGAGAFGLSLNTGAPFGPGGAGSGLAAAAFGGAGAGAGAGAGSGATTPLVGSAGAGVGASSASTASASSIASSSASGSASALGSISASSTGSLGGVSAAVLAAAAAAGLPKGEYMIRLSPELLDLISQLVEVDPACRLGTRDRVPKKVVTGARHLRSGSVSASPRLAATPAWTAGSPGRDDEQTSHAEAASQYGASERGGQGGNARMRPSINQQQGRLSGIHGGIAANIAQAQTIAAANGGFDNSDDGEEENLSDSGDIGLAPDAAEQRQRRASRTGTAGVPTSPGGTGSSAAAAGGGGASPGLSGMRGKAPFAAMRLGGPSRGSFSHGSPVAGPTDGSSSPRARPAASPSGGKGAGGGGGGGGRASRPVLVRGRDEHGQWIGLHAGFAAIKNHPFFASVDWDAMADLRVPAPIQPRVNVAAIAQTFKTALPDKFRRGDGVVPKRLLSDEQALFTGFEYNNVFSAPTPAAGPAGAPAEGPTALAIEGAAGSPTPSPSAATGAATGGKDYRDRDKEGVRSSHVAVAVGKS